MTDSKWAYNLLLEHVQFSAIRHMMYCSSADSLMQLSLQFNAIGHMTYCGDQEQSSQSRQGRQREGDRVIPAREGIGQAGNEGPHQGSKGSHCLP